MDILGIAATGLLISWTALCIERCVAGHEGWMIGFIVTVLGLMISLTVPFHDSIMIHRPEKVEKTSFNLVVQDSLYGIMMTENVTMYNSSINKIIAWKKSSDNVYGWNVKEATGLGSTDDAWTKEYLHMLPMLPIDTNIIQTITNVNDPWKLEGNKQLTNSILDMPIVFNMHGMWR